MTQREHDPVHAPKHYTSGASEIGRPALKALGFTADDFEMGMMPAINRNHNSWILGLRPLRVAVQTLWTSGMTKDAKKDLESSLAFLDLAISENSKKMDGQKCPLLLFMRETICKTMGELA